MYTKPLTSVGHPRSRAVGKLFCPECRGSHFPILSKRWCLPTRPVLIAHFSEVGGVVPFPVDLPFPDEHLEFAVIVSGPP